ncbi:MAG: uL15 family ribosomal protein [Candidatus Ryanbacteria bacterium]|nr:uL15 family ribosomal protein [Candidatus Ryanbacteria bacterium]
MQAHTLKLTQRRRRKVRIGRGGKRGSFSGRGIKGQKARAGRRIRPEVRDLIMKMPKRRGHRHTGPEKFIAAVSAGAIAKKFSTSEVITPKALVARRLVRKHHGKVPYVKIVGPFEALKKHAVRGVSFSRQKPE